MMKLSTLNPGTLSKARKEKGRDQESARLSQRKYKNPSAITGDLKLSIKTHVLFTVTTFNPPEVYHCFRFRFPSSLS